MMLASASALRGTMLGALLDRQLEVERAHAMVEALITASLFGIDSHGVRLFPQYIKQIDDGVISPMAELKFSREGSFLLCDANWTVSHYAARKLLEQLAGVALDFGVAVGTIIHSDHIGALGVHAVNADLGDFITLSFSNANQLALGPDGGRGIFGTNPLSLVTGAEENLLYVDLSTTQFTMNRVKMLGERGMSLPPGVARDSSFLPTDSAVAAKYLEPLGGHKGFALALLVEALTSGLSGSDHSAEIPEMYSDGGERRNLSHTFIVLRPDFVGGSGSDPVITRSRQFAKQAGLDGLPGQREFKTKKTRLRDGIPLEAGAVQFWLELGLSLD